MNKEETMNVKLALELSRYVHNVCKDVPHDIGIHLEKIVRKHKSAQSLKGEGGWISVKDRLPDPEGEDYLVVVKNKNKEGGIFLYDIAQYDDGIWHKNNTWEYATHWKPLPAPPNE